VKCFKYGPPNRLDSSVTVSGNSLEIPIGGYFFGVSQYCWEVINSITDRTSWPYGVYS